VPEILSTAVTSIEDQHFEEHWGIDFPRIAASDGPPRDSSAQSRRASTITNAACRESVLDRSDDLRPHKSGDARYIASASGVTPNRKSSTACSANSLLRHGNYGFAAGAQFYFGQAVTDLNLQEAALLAGMVPDQSPIAILKPAHRRNLVLRRMEEEGNDFSRGTPANAKKMRSACIFNIRATTGTLFF